MELDGSFLVYYISNLVLMHKYTDAMTTIEKFGINYPDQLCKANLIKLKGLILMENERNKFKEAQ